MLDRLFMPALTFTLLVAATAAFATEFSPATADSPAAREIVRFETVVVRARSAESPVALSDQAAGATAVR